MLLTDTGSNINTIETFKQGLAMLHKSHLWIFCLLLAFVMIAGCGSDDCTGSDCENPDGDLDGDAELTDGDQPTSFSYDVPLDPKSPWPKFRRNAKQTGAAEWNLTDDGADFWAYPTGKGIFSSPIVGADGTVYCGSADRFFYALNADGSLKWKKETGEIIDSAALLDDKGRVYFGSGDGHIYALDAQSGEEVWTFQADDPAENNAFIRWFEGNITIASNGMLIAGNDNFFIYAIDRDTGERIWRITMSDQTWSLPAIDVENERIYIGNNNVVDIFGNVFAYDFDGNRLWKQTSLGTIAASALLLDNGAFVLGGYDGFSRAYDGETGNVRWEFAAKDHIYASAALHPDGWVLQAGADGSIYALDPDDGTEQWAFDWGAPIRSSPAVDGQGQIYAGTGDGYLVVLNSDGTLKWALKLIDDDRDDLNASPALGMHAIYIAGESGEIFGVPYDYCLRSAQASNPACMLGPDEPLPDDSVEIRFTTNFGTPLQTAPDSIAPNRALAFTLMVREGGDTTLALIDNDNMTITLDPPSEVDVQISADRRFVTVVPESVFAGDNEGKVTITLSGDYLISPDRQGLAMSGGTKGGSYNQDFVFDIQPALAEAVPALQPSIGQPVSAWELRRLAAPYPTLMPSYNQIGFDSLHFVITLIDKQQDNWLGWVTEGRPTGEDGATVIEPETHGVFPVQMSYQNGGMTLINEAGFGLEIMSADLSFNTFRISAMLNADGEAPEAATVYAKTLCAGIPLYGQFLRLLGLCNPESDMLIAYGAAILEPYNEGRITPVSGIGAVSFDSNGERVTATVTGSSIKASEHTINLLVTDAELRPLQLDYGLDTELESDSNGNLTSVSIGYDAASAPEAVLFYLIVDGAPLAREAGNLVIPTDGDR